MAIGQLSIEIGARLDNFEQGLQRVGAMTEAVGGRLAGAFKSAGMAAAGLAGVGSFAVLQAKIGDAISSMAELKDAAEKTGASIENMSALKGVAKIGDHDFGAVEAAVIRLNKALHGTDDESKGAGKALAALGLDLQKLRDMDPADAFLEIAKAQEQFADGGGKSAAMMALLGKSGAALIPYMHDLAEQGKLVGKVTAEQAAAADEYEKNLKKLQAAWSGLTRQMAAAVVGPAKDITDWMVKAQKEGGALQAVLMGIGAAVVKAFGGDINPGAMAENNVREQFSRLAQLRRQLAVEEQTLAEGKGLDGLLGGQLAQRKIDQLKKDIDQTQRALNAAIGKRDRMLSDAATANEPKSTALNNETFGAPEKKTKDPHADDYQKLIQSLNEKIAVQTEDLNSVEALTQAQKDYAKFQRDLASGALVLSEAEKRVAESYWAVYLARNKAVELEKAQKKADGIVGDYERANAQTVERIRREGELALMTERQRAIAQALYKVEDEGRAIRERIIRDVQDETAQKLALAQAEEELAAQKERVSQATAASFDQQRTFEFGWSKAFRRYQDEAGNAAKVAEDVFARATDGMADALTQFAMTGKLNFTSLANTMISEIIRVQMRAAAAPITQGIGNWMRGLFSGSGGQSGAELAIAADINSAGLGGFAKGGAFDGVQTFAKGGAFTNSIVSNPTLFKFANGSKFGLMGEAGPEAVMPLARDGQGRLGVRAGASAMPAININVTNAAGSDVQVQPSVRRNTDGGIDIEMMVRRVFLNDLSGNGPMAQGMAGRFGLATKGY